MLKVKRYGKGKLCMKMLHNINKPMGDCLMLSEKGIIAKSYLDVNELESIILMNCLNWHNGGLVSCEGLPMKLYKADL